MAFTASFTAQQGLPYKGDIEIGAGSAEAQSDTISLNIDATNLTKGQALVLIDNIKAAVHAADWPVN